MHFPRLVLAGAHSGVGKTTLSLALMASLIERGLVVQPFKVGPDYIDPGFHDLVTGRTSHSLDAWLLGEDELRGLFHRYAVPGPGALSFIEGAMGLFDGLGSTPFAGTAHVASLLDAPVVLVLDAQGLSLSAAAQVHGYASFRPGHAGKNPCDLTSLRLAGVILNRVSGKKHYDLLRRCIEDHTDIPCLGFLTRNAAPPLPQRHLGLIPAEEQEELAECIAALAREAGHCLDMEALYRLAGSAPPLADAPGTGQNPFGTALEQTSLPSAFQSRKHAPHSPSVPNGSALPGPEVPDAALEAANASLLQSRQIGRRNLPATPGKVRGKSPVRIGIARDAAFSFYYQANLDFLEKRGVELIPFSPLGDVRLPKDLDGLYLGGGFPEIFAARLHDNGAFRTALRHALEDGLPAYAECGGMLYLCETLASLAGAARPASGDAARHFPKDEEPPVGEFAMTGFFPYRAEMTPRLQPFGYVTVTLLRDCLLGPAGRSFRAHEFHYSRLLHAQLFPLPETANAVPDVQNMPPCDDRALPGKKVPRNTPPTETPSESPFSCEDESGLSATAGLAAQVGFAPNFQSGGIEFPENPLRTEQGDACDIWPPARQSHAEKAPVFLVRKEDGRFWHGGLTRKNVLAGYPHVHFCGCPEIAESFIATCRAVARKRGQKWP